ncbi:MAG: hypothetical protein HVK32_03125 [Pelagibacteraceae bacterium]|nr:hypothetical protein [Pelagibacteraceae bacterium]
MILNYIKRLMGWRTERVDYANITFQIQKQILKRRYTEVKQNRTYEKQQKFNRSVVRYADTDLAIKDAENVIFLKKKRLQKFN